MKRRVGSVSSTPVQQAAPENESPTRARATSDYLNVSRLETSQESGAINDEPL